MEKYIPEKKYFAENQNLRDPCKEKKVSDAPK